MNIDLRLDRLAQKIELDLEAGCWLWQGAQCGDGYGQWTIHRQGQVPAHRAVYHLLVEPIPDGLELDHLCGNRLCVNPDHLEPVTHAENKRRQRSGFCSRCGGLRDKPKLTFCRQCRAAYAREWRASKRANVPSVKNAAKIASRPRGLQR